MKLTLKKLNSFHGRPGPLLFVIMDGIGLGKKDDGDAVYTANTPVLDELMKSPLTCSLKAHGPAVGLPGEDDMGNSEVGHNAFGAGRVFAQGAKLVNISVETGKIFQGDTWKSLIKKGLEGGAIHFIGLLSDGNVHSHTRHLFAMIRDCARAKVKKVRVHVLLDGRDVGPRTALNYIDPLESLLHRLNQEQGVDYRIASGGGRMNTTMDRYEADWGIVEKGWNAHVLGRGRAFLSAREAVETYYNESHNGDQDLDSFVITGENQKPVGTIEDGDGVVFFNFRGDRALEISRAFEEEDFDKFDRVRHPKVFYAGMMEYDGDLHVPRHYLVEPPDIDRTVSEYLCHMEISSFALAETQKYGHVTYFWNGNNVEPFNHELEKYLEIASDVRVDPNIDPFEECPRMKAPEVTEAAVKLYKSGKYRFGRVNFANGDMVGHTGNFNAAVKAVQAVDRALGVLKQAVEEMKGIMVVTADHGNADEMFMYEKGVKKPKTSHTLNPVPFMIYDPGYGSEYTMAPLESRGLTNTAATLLNLMGFEKPGDYDPSLIQFT